MCRAALEVFGTMTEVFAVDTSPKMNDFARLLLQGGNDQARLPAGYFFRLHLPRESEVNILPKQGQNLHQNILGGPTKFLQTEQLRLSKHTIQSNFNSPWHSNTSIQSGLVPKAETGWPKNKKP